MSLEATDTISKHLHSLETVCREIDTAIVSIVAITSAFVVWRSENACLSKCVFIRGMGGL